MCASFNESISVTASEQRNNSLKSALNSYYYLYVKGCELIDRCHSGHDTFPDFIVASPKDLLMSFASVDKRVRSNLLATLKVKYARTYFTITVEDLLPSIHGDDFDTKKRKAIANKVLVTLRDLDYLTESGAINHMKTENVSDLEAALAADTRINGKISASNILDILRCVSYRASDNAVFLRLTKTEFLDPRVLSELSDNKISIETANLLVLFLGIRTGSKSTPAVDPNTGCFVAEARDKFRSKDQFHDKLCILDYKSKSLEIKEELIRIFEEVKHTVFDEFFDKYCDELRDGFVSLSTRDELTLLYNWNWMMQTARECWVDALKTKALPSTESTPLQLSQYQILLHGWDFALDAVHVYLRKLIDACPDCNEDWPMFDPLRHERESKIQRAHYQDTNLNQILLEFKHVICLFVKFSTTIFELRKEDERVWDATWTLDNCSIMCKYTLESSAALSIRHRDREKRIMKITISE